MTLPLCFHPHVQIFINPHNNHRGSPSLLLPPINAGILFLQLGEETRRVHLTHELTSLDTLRALIVHMFPQRLTMAMLRYQNMQSSCYSAVNESPLSHIIMESGDLLVPPLACKWLYGADC